MVSASKPPVIDKFLAEAVKRNRESLFEPWVAMMSQSKDLQGEIDRTVDELQVFFNKWVVEILIVLGQGSTLRYSELKKSLEGISGRTLSQRLKDLEAQGLVKRQVFDEMPVRVEYSLTKRGGDVAVLALPLVLYLMANRR